MTDPLRDAYSMSAAESDAVVEVFRELGGAATGVSGSVDLVSETAILALRPPGRRRSVRVASDELGVDVELLSALWSNLGVGFDDQLSDAEVDALGQLAATESIIGRAGAVEVSRVVGLATRQIAESIVSSVRLGFELVALTGGGDDAPMDRATLARSYHALTSQALPTVNELIDVAMRRHLAVSAKRDWAPDADASVAIQHAVVGFADLVGFTAWSARASDASLAAALDAFEGTVWTVATATGVEVVKLIGDEVMFTADTTEGAVRFGRALVQAAPGLDEGGLRIGVARGRLLARTGDLFGPTVNLASRLVGAASAGCALVGGDAMADIDDGRVLPPMRLAGFDDPIPVREVDYRT